MKYIVTYVVTELCEEYTEVLLCEAENIEWIIEKIMNKYYGLYPKNIAVFKIGEEITEQFDTKTKFDEN